MTRRSAATTQGSSAAVAQDGARGVLTLPAAVPFRDPNARNLAAFRRRVEREARGDLKWLPRTVGLEEIVGILHTLQEQVTTARLQGRPPTARQERIWALLAEDLSEAEVAHALGISIGTVKSHVDRLKHKIGVTSVAELKKAHRWMTSR